MTSEPRWIFLNWTNVSDDSRIVDAAYYNTAIVNLRAGDKPYGDFSCWGTEGIYVRQGTNWFQLFIREDLLEP